LTPVTFGDSQLVQNDKLAEKAKDKSKTAPPNPEKKAQRPENEKAEKAAKAGPKQAKEDVPPPAPRPELPSNKDD
jgi:hypothetical protein